MASFTGLHVTSEQVKCFAETEPNSRKRPDVSTFNLPKLNPGKSAIIVDVAVVSPVTPTEKVSLTQSSNFFSTWK